MTRVYVALDDLSKNHRSMVQSFLIAQKLADSDLDLGFKMNLDFLLAEGVPQSMRRLRSLRRPIFVDLKMWNGERTMRETLELCAVHGAGYVTCHALGAEELRKAITSVDSRGEMRGMRVAANTVLSHYSEAYCQRHFRRSRAEAVRHFSEVAVEFGCHAITLPGVHLDVVRDLRLTRIVPGVRPEGSADDGRHDSPVTPRQALDGGADLIVCGSPIMHAPDPVEAVRRILESLK